MRTVTRNLQDFSLSNQITCNVNVSKNNLMANDLIIFLKNTSLQVLFVDQNATYFFT